MFDAESLRSSKGVNNGTSRLGSAKILMLLATLARMGVGLITFVLLARYLGPTSFGLIATAMAYTTFVGIATDYGLATSALRQAAARPENTREVMASAVALKMFLTVIVAPLGLGAMIKFMPSDHFTVYSLVFVGAIAFSFADLLLVAVRANLRFALEARLVISTSITMLAVVGGVAMATSSVIDVAIAFAATRLGYLCLTAWVTRGWIGNPIERRLGDIVKTAKTSASYALDNLLTSLLSQIDVLVFGLMLPIREMGIYQAGARLVQVIVPVAVALSAVYVPTLSKSFADRSYGEFQKSAKLLFIEFLLLGTFAGAAFITMGPYITKFIYGPSYASLDALWPGFGAYAFIRLLAAAFSVQLTATGNILPRILAQVVTIMLTISASGLIIERFGLASTSGITAACSLPLLVIFAVSARRNRGRMNHQ